MTLFTYLMLALLIAACSIPLLDVIASWYYLRFTQGVPAFGLTFPWARWPPGNSSPRPSRPRTRSSTKAAVPVSSLTRQESTWPVNPRRRPPG